MLYIVLVLVLAAFGLLVAALTMANTLWAWLSVAVSVIAAGLLILDWLGGRRRAATEPADRPEGRVRDAQGSEGVLHGAPAEPAPAEDPPAESPPAESAVAEPAEPAATQPPPPPEPPPELPTETTLPADGLGEPDEEPTDAADLLIVAGLSVEVRVIDEHPRYHLANCIWLAGRATIPIAVSEARQLGFTPCVRCGPDAQLAAKHRADR